MEKLSPLTSLSTSGRLTASVVAAAVVAAVVEVALVLVFFTANGSAVDNLLPIFNFFLPSAVAVFVVAFLAFAIGAARSRAIAAAAGILVGIVAALIGGGFGLLAGGVEITPEILALLLGTLIGPNLLFVVVTAVAMATVGVSVFRRTARSAVVPRRIAIVRPPSSALAEGELTHLPRVAVNAELADIQWDAYVEVFESRGYEIVEVEPADHLPDSVFVEDVLLVFGDLAVITSPGAESRRAETHAAELCARELGLKIHTIELPGTLDGGDVLRVGETVYVGRSGRTNADGIRQLRELLSAYGLSVVTVPVKDVLHLKSSVTALPDGTLVGYSKLAGYSKLIDGPQVFGRFVAVPEPSGAAVVVLDDSTVLMATSAPKSAKLIEDLGYRVVTVDISEFEKLEGCVTCLSVRLP